jgi:hypothetical protein
MTEVAEIRRGIEQISTMVDAARRLVAEGHLVDLRSLETRVATFCSAIQNVSTDAAAQIRPVMLGLVDELGRLDAAVRQSQSETAGRSANAGFDDRGAGGPEQDQMLDLVAAQQDQSGLGVERRHLDDPEPARLAARRGEPSGQAEAARRPGEQPDQRENQEQRQQEAENQVEVH